MYILGLTGSIGMGKSTVAAMLRARGSAVFDADAEVHRLYAAEAVPLIDKVFPGTVVDGRVDRPKLAAALAGDAERFRKLEKIVHPLVRAAEQQFLEDEHARGASVVTLEIPLLLETDRAALVDAVAVVSAPSDVQRTRVLARPGMTEARLDALLSRQLSDAEKRARADFVVDTGGGLERTEAEVDVMLSALKSRPALAFDRHWR